jgi:hypothetical protein
MFRVYPVYAELRSEPRRANPTRSLYPVYAACPVYPVYAELRSEPLSERTRRARPTLSARPVPSSSDLCALCVSALSSLSLSLFNFKLLALSVVEGSAVTCRPFFANSHRITSFAHPHPLTPIESHSCKKQGEGVPLTPSRARRASCLCATRRNPNNSNPFMGLLHNPPTAGGGGLLSNGELQSSSRPPRSTGHGIQITGHGTGATELRSQISGPYSLLTSHFASLTSYPLKPPLQMAHPYTCTCKKGPAAREPRYQPCAAS